MDNKQIEKAADEYVMLHFIDDSNVVLNDPFPEAQATYKRAFIAGAQYALSHQWFPVAECLPEHNTDCIIYTHDDQGPVKMFAWFDGENFHDEQTDDIFHPEFWMPLATLMQSNPETAIDAIPL